MLRNVLLTIASLFNRFCFFCPISDSFFKNGYWPAFLSPKRIIKNSTTYLSKPQTFSVSRQPRHLRKKFNPTKCGCLCDVTYTRGDLSTCDGNFKTHFRTATRANCRTATVRGRAFRLFKQKPTFKQVAPSDGDAAKLRSTSGDEYCWNLHKVMEIWKITNAPLLHWMEYKLLLIVNKRPD